ncbi:MAG: lamin tail domain-containing protein, partial [Myxococcota bacterium]
GTGGGGGDMDAGFDAGTVSEQIAAVRTAIDATTDGGVGQLTIRGAFVSYLKPLVPGAGTLADGGSANDMAGFFIQGAQGGPALFIAVDPANVPGGIAQGNLVDLTVDTVTKINGLRAVTAISAVTVATTTPNPIPGLIASVTAEDFLNSATIDLFESRLISFDGTVTNEPGALGSGYKAVQVSTTGTPDAGTNFRLRAPVAVMDALYFGPGCTFSVSGVPLWRFTAAAQPSPFNASELTNIVCPAPALISANATSNTAATVSFSRDLAAMTVDAGAFSIVASDGGVLAVADATLSAPRSVALVTGAQVGGETYTVSVNSSVTDMRGTGASSATTTFVGAAGAVCSPGVVISQVFGGNSNTSAAYNADYVELHNRTAAPVNIAGWSLQYQSSTGTSWTAMALASGTIQPGGFFLISVNAGSGANPLPTPDLTLTGGQNMSGTAGKIALVNTTTALSGQCPSTSTAIVDLVSYGTVTNACAEGMSAPAPSTANAIFRKDTAAGPTLACVDSNQNNSDFVAAPAAPRNSSATPVICTCN